MRSRLLCLVLLAALTSCADESGSAQPTSSPSASPSDTPTPATCTTFTPPTAGVQADLDGDGEKELVALVD